MTTTEIIARRSASDIKFETALAIRQLLTQAEEKLAKLDQEYDEDEILALVTDDA